MGLDNFLVRSSSVNAVQRLNIAGHGPKPVANGALRVDYERRHRAFAVKSVLKEMLYHFQELSRLGYCENSLLDQTKYATLKSDIFCRDALRQISAVQLVALFTSLSISNAGTNREWSLLCDALKSKCHTSISSSPQILAHELANCVYCIAKSNKTFVVRDKALEVVFKYALSMSSQWTAKDMGQLLYFMRKCEDRNDIPVWDTTLKQIAFRFGEKLNSCTVREIACVYHEMSLMRVLPAMTVHKVCSHVAETGFSHIDIKSITLLVLSFARLSVYKADFFRKLGNYLAYEGGLCRIKDNRNMCRLFYSFSKLGFKHPGLFKGIIDRAVTQKSDLNQKDLGMLFHSIGKIGVNNPAALKELCAIVQTNLKNISPLNLVVVINALVRVGYYDGNLHAYAKDSLLKLSVGLTPTQLELLSASIKKWENRPIVS